VDAISASSPVKSGSGIFCKEGQKIFRSRAKRRVLTGCGRSDNPALQGRDEERAFPVRTRNGQGKEGRGLTGVVVQLPIRDVEPGPVEAFQHQAPVV
jgi:hypothetical protein